MVTNIFDASKQDVEINNKTSVFQTTVDFEYSLLARVAHLVPEVKDLQELIFKAEVNQSMEVSVLVYLDISDRPCITTASKYHSNSVVKKELRANDNTAVIKLVFYDDQIG